jgi:hypothetical protein
MDKPILRLGFVDYFKPIDEFFIESLSKNFHIIRDDSDPDYLIFCDENYGTENRKFDHKKVIKIFYTGENRRYWNYNCHFAITFDHIESEKHYRLPLYVVDNWFHINKDGLKDIRAIPRCGLAQDKTGFCSFVVKNPGCPERNNIFNLISKYKNVDSAGPHFNTVGYLLPRGEKVFHTSKIDFLNTRKFNICYENGSYPGYVTEKIFHAFYANTIPIYWGSPTVDIDFNHKAFISRHNYETDEEMLEAIIRLDTHDDEYNDMLAQPSMLAPDKSDKFFNMDRFSRWFRLNVYKGVLR